MTDKQAVRDPRPEQTIWVTKPLRDDDNKVLTDDNGDWIYEDGRDNKSL